MAMPSLVYRTNAITQRVLSSNHNSPSISSTIQEKEKLQTTANVNIDEPSWLKESIYYHAIY